MYTHVLVGDRGTRAAARRVGVGRDVPAEWHPICTANFQTKNLRIRSLSQANS